MTTQETQQGKVIGNVAVLDVRTATQATIASIKRVDNAAMVLFSPETAELVTQLNIGNVAVMVEAPQNAQIINGQMVLSHASFASQGEVLSFVINGPLIVKPDVLPAEIEAGLGVLVVNGPILCPDGVAGVLRSKIRHLNGPMMSGVGEGLILGNLALTESYLRSLDDASALNVLGSITAVDVLTNDLLEQKIQKLHVQGRVTCREENAPTLLARLHDGMGTAKVTIIPTGYTYLEKPLVLDAIRLQALPSKKLYGAWVRIADDVEPGALNAAVESLIVTDTLIAPAALAATVAAKCNLLETQAIFYAGELWLIENETTLPSARFDYLADKATLLVFGELTIALDVEPNLLATRLHKVHNFGEIHCTPAQMAALQARLGTDAGEFVDTTPSGADEDEQMIGNVAYLKL